jgi:hypothetical protein
MKYNWVEGSSSTLLWGITSLPQNTESMIKIKINKYVTPLVVKNCFPSGVLMDWIFLSSHQRCNHVSSWEEANCCWKDFRAWWYDVATWQFYILIFIVLISLTTHSCYAHEKKNSSRIRFSLTLTFLLLWSYACFYSKPSLDSINL